MSKPTAYATENEDGTFTVRWERGEHPSFVTCIGHLRDLASEGYPVLFC